MRTISELNELAELEYNLVSVEAFAVKRRMGFGQTLKKRWYLLLPLAVFPFLGLRFSPPVNAAIWLVGLPFVCGIIGAILEGCRDEVVGFDFEGIRRELAFPVSVLIWHYQDRYREGCCAVLLKDRTGYKVVSNGPGSAQIGGYLKLANTLSRELSVPLEQN